MSIFFHKYEALGNDYIVIDPDSIELNSDDELIKRICDRHRGVGSDGILFGPIWKEGIAHLKIFNPDGSEAEKSGNGLRIFAQHLFLEKMVTSKKFKMATVSGISEAEILKDDASLIKIDMGRPSFKPEDIPLKSENEWIDKELDLQDTKLKLTCLSVGNPHAVFFSQDWDEAEILKFGPEIENNRLFPKRTNVQMVKVIDRNNIEIRIWERGAGYTMASGSSSCAAGYVAYYLGKTDSIIAVNMPGGIIQLEITDSNRLYITGEVKRIFSGKTLEGLI